MFSKCPAVICRVSKGPTLIETLGTLYMHLLHNCHYFGKELMVTHRLEIEWEEDLAPGTRTELAERDSS